MTDSSDTSHVVARAEGRPVAPGPSAEPDDLVSMIHAARSRVDALRAGTVDPTRLLAARGVLLGAIESYAGDLIRRGLPIPPRLRDDLRLQRGIRDLSRAAEAPYRRQGSGS